MTPHFSNVYCLALCRRYGVYSVVQSLFYLKLIAGMIMLTFGSHWPRLLCLFIVRYVLFLALLSWALTALSDDTDLRIIDKDRDDYVVSINNSDDMK